MTDGFILMYKDLPGLQVVVPSFPLLRTLLTLCYFPMVWHRRPAHPMKPKRAEFGQVRLGPNFCQAQLPRAHLGVVLFRRPVGRLLRIVQVLHQCYNLHISSPLLLMCMKCCAPLAYCKCNQLRHLHCKHPCPQVFLRILLRKECGVAAMFKNTNRLTMVLLVTIGFACVGKSCQEQCGQAVARLSNTARPASNTCAACKRIAPFNHGNAHC